MTEFATLVAAITGQNEEGRFRVSAVPGSPSYLAALSPAGGPALLVRCEPQVPSMPIRLAGIEARYDVRCWLRDAEEVREERLSIIECTTVDPEAQRFFCGCADQLIALLKPKPATTELAQAVDRLVAMFRAMSQPARTDIVGLIGELCAIYVATDPSLAVRAWRSDPNERFDFVAGKLRLDVKSSSSADRVHHLSSLQASSAQGTTGILASVLVQMATGGTAVASLVDKIATRLGDDHEAIFRLREAISLTMGATTPLALQAAFDLSASVQSLRYYDMASVPALRPPFPDGVSDVRFRTDLDSIESTPIAQLKLSAGRDGRAILPRSTPPRP